MCRPLQAPDKGLGIAGGPETGHPYKRRHARDELYPRGCNNSLPRTFLSAPQIDTAVELGSIKTMDTPYNICKPKSFQYLSKCKVLMENGIMLDFSVVVKLTTTDRKSYNTRISKYPQIVCS
jgi:hypothetical protein